MFFQDHILKNPESAGPMQASAKGSFDDASVKSESSGLMQTGAKGSFDDASVKFRFYPRSHAGDQIKLRAICPMGSKPGKNIPRLG